MALLITYRADARHKGTMPAEVYAALQNANPPRFTSTQCSNGALPLVQCRLCRGMRGRHCIMIQYCFDCGADITAKCDCPSNTPKVDSTSQPTTQAKSKLLSLPLELREQIYGYALDQKLASQAIGVLREWYQPALTRVSRQVREEALPLLFSVNTFHLDIGKDDKVLRWLRAMGDSYIQQMRNVVLQWPVSMKYSPRAMFRTTMLLGRNGGATWELNTSLSYYAGFKGRSRQARGILGKAVAASEGQPWSAKSLSELLCELHNHGLSLKETDRVFKSVEFH